jgi:hypothetical protein
LNNNDEEEEYKNEEIYSELNLLQDTEKVSL